MTPEKIKAKEGDKKISGSMVDWAAAMKAHYAWGLAGKFYESEAIKIAGLEVLAELGLPHLKGIPLPLPEFLAAPNIVFE